MTYTVSDMNPDGVRHEATFETMESAVAHYEVLLREYSGLWHAWNMGGWHDGSPCPKGAVMLRDDRGRTLRFYGDERLGALHAVATAGQEI